MPKLRGRRLLFLLAAGAQLAASCVTETAPEDGESDQSDEPGASADLPPFEWPVPTKPIKITASPLLKNKITAEPFAEPFMALGSQAGFVKFIVLMRDPSKVYFQDTNALPFHSDAAIEHIDPFVGMTRSQFDSLSLFEKDQEAILGAVLFPSDSSIGEYAIQLIRQDAFHPEMARIVFDLVNSNIEGARGKKPLYFPTFEQMPSAQTHRAFFDSAGIQIGSLDRWAKSNVCYSSGWALGKIKRVPAAEITKAFQDGRLTPNDILLTDGVPAEIPPVAGILSTAAATPNSHVAILSKTFHIPFAFLALSADADRAAKLADSEVLLEATAFDSFGGAGCQLRMIDMQGALDAETREEILAVKLPPPVKVPAKQKTGALSRDVKGLKPSDIRSFGGKASNYGSLRRAIPNNSAPAIAFSFDLWDLFQDQKMASGKTLRAEVEGRLSKFVWPPNMKELETDLEAIRKLVKKDAEFSPKQRQAIIAALESFDPKVKIRFRSSTNVEDSAVLSGAGLYDSFSGCLADDTDADTVGPSQCDPAESEEKGVFRAIQKVYASFYNTNAYLERLRHSIPEKDVGMAMLVHVSSPDELELANGVGTISPDQGRFELTLVTQLGAESVTNPSGAAQPEVVSVFQFSGDPAIIPQTKQTSSLVPLGGNVLEMPDDYEALTKLIQSARKDLIKSMGQVP